MINATCVIDSYSGGNLHTRRFALPVTAQVNIDGERAIDTATIQFPISVDCENGYDVKYIQDVASLDGLKLIMNFQDAGVWEIGKTIAGTAVNGKLKIVDESGYDMDGYCNNISSRYADSDGGRVLKFTASGDEVVIPDQKYFDNSTNSVGSTPIIDLSGMFDIYLRFRCSDTGATSKVFIDKEDGVNGISIYQSPGATGKIVVDLYNGRIIKTIAGIIQVNDGAYHTIRVTRGSDNIVRLFVDNIADGTVSSSLNYTNNTSSLILGNNYALNRIASNSFFSQVRLYCSVSLDDTNNGLVWGARRQYQTMKFGGTVWSKEDGTDKKTVQIRSFGSVINELIIQPQTYNNIYSSKTDQQILTDLVTNYLPKWSIAYGNISSNSYPTFIATGVINAIIRFFLIPINCTFHTDARKTITVETNDQDFGMTLISFVNGIYDITLDGKDTTGTTNYLEVVATGTLSNTSQTFIAGSTGSNTFTLSHSPIDVVVTDNGVTVAASALTINHNAGTVTFNTTATHTIIISYNYDNITSGVSLYETFQDITSQTNNGFIGKRITLNGVADSTSLNNFGSNYISKYKDVNRRWTISSPFAVNFARSNLRISITNTIKGVTNQANTIKAYTMNYPDMTMTLHVGSYLYDSYDLDNAYGVAISDSNTAFVNANSI